MRPASALSYCRVEKQYIREFLAEFIGTFILIAVGDGGIASYVLRKNSTPDIFCMCFCYGIGAQIGISATLHVSGAHINPAVTVALASVGKFPLNKVLHYIFGQFLGAFVGAAVVYINYIEAIDSFDNGIRSTYDSNTSTGIIFSTYPAQHVTISGALIDQVIGTALLMFAVVAVTDDKGINIPKHLVPTVLALIITGLCVSYGLNCSATLNPARDLSPRLFTMIAGWDSTFSALNGHYWWVAGLLGPVLGGIIGVWIYYLTIELHYIKSLPYTESHTTDPLFVRDEDLKDDRKTFGSIGSTDSDTIKAQRQANRIKLVQTSSE